MPGHRCRPPLTAREGAALRLLESCIIELVESPGSSIGPLERWIELRQRRLLQVLRTPTVSARRGATPKARP